MKNGLKVFTLQEANSLIPTLEILLSGIMKKKEEFDRRHDYYFMNELLNQAEASHTEEGPSDGLTAEARELDECADGFRREIQKIRELGCVVSRLDRGIVEFLAKRDGQWIYFCWRAGEKRVTHYRRLSGKPSDLHILANGTT